MSSNTVAFIPMSLISSVPSFMESLKNSVNDLIKETYEKEDVAAKINMAIPLPLNQSKINTFNYQIFSGMEHFTACFNLFIPTENYDTKNTHATFKDFNGNLLSIPNERRILWIFLNSRDYGNDSDYEDSSAPKEEKLVVNFGNWGMSEEVIQRIFDDYGVPYYYCKDDCEESFKLIQKDKVKEVN